MPNEQVPLVATLSMKDYVDSQMAEIRRAVEIAKDVPPPESVPLRDHITAILDEQRRAMGTAQEEREKAAQALRVELARSIEDGDRNLLNHVEQQVHQIREALESAERLETTRFEALKRELDLITSAAADAIAKAETATEKRFGAVDSALATLGSATSTYMPREVAEAQFAELRRSISEIAEKVGKVV